MTGCDGVAAGPTFVSIECRLDALLALLGAETGLDALQPKLVHSVQTGRDRTLDAGGLCGGSNPRKTKKRLQQAAKALTQYAHRLNGLPARKKLDAAVRQRFLGEAAPIQQDLRTLRLQVRCPDDAPAT